MDLIIFVQLHTNTGISYVMWYVTMLLNCN